MKAASIANVSATRPSKAARQRALVHIPWAIAPGNPNRRAESGCRWIGLRSPDTAAYRRPMWPGTSQSALTSSGASSSLSGGEESDDPSPCFRYVLRPRHTAAPSLCASVTSSN